jgi:alpha-tubulin suppressor-like RCC1 family protein
MLRNALLPIMLALLTASGCLDRKTLQPDGSVSGGEAGSSDRPGISTLDASDSAAGLTIDAALDMVATVEVGAVIDASPADSRTPQEAGPDLPAVDTPNPDAPTDLAQPDAPVVVPSPDAPSDVLADAPDVGGTCPTGQKSCIGSSGTTCIAASACCANADCPGTCQSCDTSHACSAVVSQDDPNGRCAGTCDATGGCKSKKGQTCQTVAAGCASGTTCSPDGYCCDTACAASCQACDIPGYLGTCTPVASGNPHGNRASCGTDATCGGTCGGKADGTCSYPTKNCGTGPTCSGNSSIGQAVCSGGSCVTPVATACAGGLACVGTACKTSCAADGDCVAGYFCQASKCHLAATQVSVGGAFACALISDGSVECWGRNDFGALGPTGPTSTSVIPTSNVPIKVTGLGGAKAISAGAGHVCALLTNGAVWCWGQGDRGQLGNGTIPSSNFSATPVAVSGLQSAVTAIASGANTSCALVGASSALYCWGDNIYGQLGSGATANLSATPVQMTGLGSPSAISAGITNCAIVSGSIDCWGGNGDGQAGQPITGNGIITAPTGVSGLSGPINAQGLSVGDYHTCAIITGGSVYCWGWNMYGQLGNASTAVGDHATSAVPVQGLASGATQVSAGYAHTCALLTTGTVSCWGVQRNGALGDGVIAGEGVSAPVSVLNVAGATSVSTNYLQACALINNGSVKCWGFGSDGELGNSASADSSTAVNVTGW